MEQKLSLLYKGALADGVLTEKEITILLTKATEAGEDINAFKKQLMDDYIASILKKGLVLDKAKVIQLVKRLELDVNEYIMLIDAQCEEQKEIGVKKGKDFINDLKSKIERTIVYNHSGKYGRAEIDTSDTRHARADILFYANPQSPEEIYEYIVLLDSLNYAWFEDWEKRVNTIIKEGDKSFPSNPLIIQARKCAKRSKLTYLLHRAWHIGLTVVLLLLGLSVFWLIDSTGGKIFYGIAWVILGIPLSFLPITNIKSKESRDRIIK